jgi:hypothetical protein
MVEDVFIHDVEITLSWPVVLCAVTVLLIFVLGAVVWLRRR